LWTTANTLQKKIEIPKKSNALGAEPMVLSKQDPSKKENSKAHRQGNSSNHKLAEKKGGTLILVVRGKPGGKSSARRNRHGEKKKSISRKNECPA